MAASAKRKQEEKHLKMLREMTSLPPNRKCFDCDQRGPTYANMTVGSFVCTTCSGILRGLNPPHRVKSISMTTFTQQEIEFLQKHSNEVCKHIWLGLYDDKSSVVPDFREPQKVKEFLQEKYEKKRWYVPPEQAKVIASVQASISGSSASSTSSTPEVLPQPLKTLHLTKTPSNQSPVTSRVQAQSAGQEKKFDLLSDLGGDIFAAPQAQTASSSNFANFAHFNRPSAQNNSTTDFANFDSFGNASVPSHFGTSPPSKPSLQQTHTGGGMSIPPLPSMAPAPPQSSLSTKDRYAALAELDSALGSTVTSGSVQGVFGGVPGAAAPPAQPGLPNMQQGFAAAPSTNPFVAAGMVQEPMSTNPFQANGRAAASASFGTGSMSMPAGFGNTTSYCLPTSFSGTFQQQFPGQGPFPPPAAYHQQPNGGFPAYGQAKPMGNYGQAVTRPGISSNPFMGGGPAGPYPTGGSSTNPFL
ncbi:arf-GAP domain and FG repeat-containing protein 1b isoform X1 [Sinocyclocheilus anshuiensis]|uniref:Arf-GAP domain and FG repeat-containing protein 1-like n=1 Tax=Sinocyclocheilus anshuiensis TaxID=1608454 RepID=A0A671RZ91_9TELE|nr:PREDICTED: arf-GAP domain and FG repeat-containing protein 1-like isoform X1 [Sinocyclocheilus anshuiensis]